MENNVANQRKILAYKMIEETSVKFLNEEAHSLSCNGYEPYGQPFLRNGCFCQAFVKYQS